MTNNQIFEKRSNVFPVEMLEDEFAKAFDKPWVLEYNDETGQEFQEQFDSDANACARQRELRQLGWDKDVMEDDSNGK